MGFALLCLFVFVTFGVFVTGLCVWLLCILFCVFLYVSFVFGAMCAESICLLLNPYYGYEI